MGKRISDNDRQWLKENPGFHLDGSSKLGKPRETVSDGSHTRATNENDGHVFEMHRTFSRRLEEYDAYESFIED